MRSKILRNSMKVETSMRLNRMIRDMMRLSRINYGDYLEDKFIQDFKLKYGSDNIPEKMRELWMEYWTLVKQEAEDNLKLYQPRKILTENEVFDIVYKHLDVERKNIKIWYVKMKSGGNLSSDLVSSFNGDHPEITERVLNQHEKIVKMAIEAIAKQEKIHVG